MRREAGWNPAVGEEDKGVEAGGGDGGEVLVQLLEKLRRPGHGSELLIRLALTRQLAHLAVPATQHLHSSAFQSNNLIKSEERPHPFLRHRESMRA